MEQTKVNKIQQIFADFSESFKQNLGSFLDALLKVARKLY